MEEAHEPHRPLAGLGGEADHLDPEAEAGGSLAATASLVGSLLTLCRDLSMEVRRAR
jgi:hypothetical protein